MRKLFAVLLTVFMVSGAAATTIESEKLFLDLEESTAEAEVKVADLTSSQFTYITSAEVEAVDAYIGEESLECGVETLTLGSEIRCDTDISHNFTVDINYSFSGLVTDTGGPDHIFRYSHPIYRPTESFTLRTTLPQGAGLQQNSTNTAFSPPDGVTGSDGRRIFVEWKKQPQIGDTLNFEVDYQDYNDERGVNYLQIIGMISLISLISGLGFLYWRRLNMENIETVYNSISDDERDVLELLEENGGEMLQKDVVNETDYSKAKISGVVSDLVEKDIVEKEKEGRSNKLRISGQYRY
jgi:uncharacterized membrane protein